VFVTEFVSRARVSLGRFFTHRCLFQGPGVAFPFIYTHSFTPPFIYTHSFTPLPSNSLPFPFPFSFPFPFHFAFSLHFSLSSLHHSLSLHISPEPPPYASVPPPALSFQSPSFYFQTPVHIPCYPSLRFPCLPVDACSPHP